MIRGAASTATGERRNKFGPNWSFFSGENVRKTKIYPVENWSVKKPIGAFLQTKAPVLDKIYGLTGG